MTSPATFAAALDAQLRRDPARPFTTFYDHDTGERVELSLATYANWVAKTAGLVQDELDGERGGLVLVDLPTHWLGAVWLGAAWTAGLVVTDDPALADEVDLVVCGPDGVDAYAVHADRVPVVALSLRPLGARFAEALPTGVVDYGAVVLAQPDSFVSYDPPSGDDPAWRDSDGTTDQSTLLAEAGSTSVVTDGGRLLTDVNPVGRGGRPTLLAPLVRGGGCVWVRHPDPDRWSALVEQERVTDQLRHVG
jgi:uncharacterized protein (TIGR03089 family)